MKFKVKIYLFFPSLYMCFFVPVVQKEEIGHSVDQDIHDLMQEKQPLNISFVVLISNSARTNLSCSTWRNYLSLTNYLL